MNDVAPATNVNTRQDFAEFLLLLRQDLIDNPAEWENKTLADFLEAASSYAEDVQGYYDNTRQAVNADQASWQTFADILRGASIYE